MFLSGRHAQYVIELCGLALYKRLADWIIVLDFSLTPLTEKNHWPSTMVDQPTSLIPIVIAPPLKKYIYFDRARSFKTPEVPPGFWMLLCFYLDITSTVLQRLCVPGAPLSPQPEIWVSPALFTLPAASRCLLWLLALTLLCLIWVVRFLAWVTLETRDLVINRNTYCFN